MIRRMKKMDYECRECGRILSDQEAEENNGMCNNCLISGNKEEEDYYNWLDYR